MADEDRHRDKRICVIHIDETAQSIDGRAAATESIISAPSRKGRGPPTKRSKSIPTFSLLAALCTNIDVVGSFVPLISPRDFAVLYRMSAHFHHVINTHLTHFMLVMARSWAPYAMVHFPWHAYRELCIRDPAMRRPLPHELQYIDRVAGATKLDEVSPTDTRMVPSIRWLKMITYRSVVCEEIVDWLAVHGHRLPRPETITAVYKMWFLLDLPTTAQRLAVIENRKYFPDSTLRALTALFWNIDMFFTDPICFTGREYIMRDWLLSEWTLTPLWNFLRGAAGKNHLDTITLYLKHSYQRPAPVVDETPKQRRARELKADMPIFGIAPNLVGRWSCELWGLGADKVLRPDELVMIEEVRRGLQLERLWISMIRSGYSDDNLKATSSVRAEDVIWTLKERRKNQRLLALQRARAGKSQARAA